MRSTADIPLDPKKLSQIYRVLLGFIGVSCAVEAALVLADLGWIGSARWRPLSYQYGGFWAGLLHGWRPNYDAQPFAMFITYAFLHSGPGHLIGNMLTLLWLGPTVVARLGTGRFTLLYFISMLGGGAVFGLLSRSPSPMVGASGAIMGLAAAWIVWDWQDRRQDGIRGWAAARWAVGATLALAVLNLVMWYWLDGVLAWQTHLGGFVAGAIMALVLGHRRNRP